MTLTLRPTAVDGALIVEPTVFAVERGFFMETWNAATFAAAGLDVAFVQDNHSRSARGVLRGLHYQLPGAQGKLVRVTAGRVWDVCVDLRRSSPTFGRWTGVELSADNRRMMWLPPGLAHGFVALEDGTDFLYKCTAPYDPANEHTLAWDDPDLAIDWRLDAIAPHLSAKDRAGKSLAESPTFA